MTDLYTIHDLIDRRDELLEAGRYEEADGINFALATTEGENLREAA